MSKKGIIGIDLFSGAGGMSLGAVMAGITVKYAIEKDKYASMTYKANHHETKVVNKDICEISTLPCNLKRNPIILFGGAPCQGFSTSNRRTNNRDNTQNWLYKEFIRLLRNIQSDWFVFENVTGIMEFESGVFFDEILSEFKLSGYECSYTVLKASDLGVPQKRNRLFIIGSKTGKKLSIKEHNELSKLTVRDAFEDLPILENGANIDKLPYAKDADNSYALLMRGHLTECTGNLVSKNSDVILRRYEYIKQGENWTSIPKELMDNYSDLTQCHTGIYHRLSEDEPSVVIGNYRKNMLIHPKSNRGLSVREAARLQSFPDNYVFKGSIGFQQQQVGNAVPPLMAKYVFEQIVNEI